MTRWFIGQRGYAFCVHVMLQQGSWQDIQDNSGQDVPTRCAWFRALKLLQPIKTMVRMDLLSHSTCCAWIRRWPSMHKLRRE